MRDPSSSLISPTKSVAVVGVGPAGAITIDALVQEGVFEKIRVFERREKPGGCWIPDPPGSSQELPDLDKIAMRNADGPQEIPSNLPAWTPSSPTYRFSDTSIYPALETNIVSKAMEFSQEPISTQRSAWSIDKHGPDTPFRHHTVVQQYVEDLVNRRGYQALLEYNTTVERIEKTTEARKWKLTLRKEVPEKQQDYWWSESFDAVVVASGHYTVPFIPRIEGLAEFAEAYPGSVEHSKSFRGPEKYRGKRVVTVGASISGPDIAASLAGVTDTPLHAVVRGKYHAYFGDWAFRNPHIQRHPPITHINSKDGDRTVFFEDGTSVSNVDHIVLGTGYSWTLHFLPKVPVRNNRLPGLYMHVFKRGDPTLMFVGAVAAGFTFKVFEWQAVLAARFLAGRITLPPLAEQERWEQERIQLKGDGVPFTALYPDFEGYFEAVRKLAGEPVTKEGGEVVGRPLPKFEKEWIEEFERGHLLRIAMWKRMNEEAEKKLQEGSNGG